MKATHPVFFLASVVTLGASGAGCEMLVQLDRSAVDAGDAGCPICADAGAEAQDGAVNMAPDAAVDADADAADVEPGDARNDGPVGDSAGAGD